MLKIIKLNYKQNNKSKLIRRFGSKSFAKKSILTPTKIANNKKSQKHEHFQEDYYNYQKVTEKEQKNIKRLARKKTLRKKELNERLDRLEPKKLLTNKDKKLLTYQQIIFPMNQQLNLLIDENKYLSRWEKEYFIKRKKYFNINSNENINLRNTTEEYKGNYSDSTEVVYEDIKLLLKEEEKDFDTEETLQEIKTKIKQKLGEKRIKSGQEKILKDVEEIIKRFNQKEFLPMKKELLNELITLLKNKDFYGIITLKNLRDVTQKLDHKKLLNNNDLEEILKKSSPTEIKTDPEKIFTENERQEVSRKLRLFSKTKDQKHSKFLKYSDRYGIDNKEGIKSQQIFGEFSEKFNNYIYIPLKTILHQYIFSKLIKRYKNNEKSIKIDKKSANNAIKINSIPKNVNNHYEKIDKKMINEIFKGNHRKEINNVILKNLEKNKDFEGIFVNNDLIRMYTGEISFTRIDDETLKELSIISDKIKQNLHPVEILRYQTKVKKNYNYEEDIELNKIIGDELTDEDGTDRSKMIFTKNAADVRENPIISYAQISQSDDNDSSTYITDISATEYTEGDRGKTVTGRKAVFVNLMKSGCHYGTIASKSNPFMYQYIFCERQKQHIFDITKSLAALRKVMHFAQALVRVKSPIWFVGNNSVTKYVTEKYAVECDEHSITSKSYQGIFTNFDEIMIQSRKKLTYKIKENNHTQLMEKFKSKLPFRQSDELPGLVILFNVKGNEVIVHEADKCLIPVAAICDSDVNPKGISYVIPGNDDLVESVEFFAKMISLAVKEVKEEIDYVSNIKKMDIIAEKDIYNEEVSEQVKRRLPTRKGKLKIEMLNPRMLLEKREKIQYRESLLNPKKTALEDDVFKSAGL